MEKKNYFTIEEMIAVPIPGKVAVNPAGNKVAYTQKTADWKKNRFINHVMACEIETGETYSVTSEEIESSDPSWSNDSRVMAFLADDCGKKQIFIKDSSGAPLRITNCDSGIDYYKWSPDGKGFFYVSTPENENLGKRKNKYGDFEFVDRELMNNRLYYIDIGATMKRSQALMVKPGDVGTQNDDDTKDVIELTDGREFNIFSFVLSPDGSDVFMITHFDPDPENTSSSTIRRLNLETGEINTLAETFESINLAISPDGKRLIYDEEKTDMPWQCNTVFTVLELGTMKKEKLDFCSYEKTEKKKLEIIDWNEAGIFFIWQDRTKGRLGCYTPSGKIETLPEKDATFFQAAVSIHTGKIAVVKATVDEAYEVHYDGVKLTDYGKLYREKVTSKKRLISWKSLDGMEIEGVLSFPPDFDENEKYPLLLIVHGGPTWASFATPTISKYYPIEQFVEKGFVILEPNYRGSSGYGEDFKRLNYRDLGTGDYADIISGVDCLIEEGFVDRERVGIMGWSQGGYISAFSTTYSDRFKAISVGAGISDWVTYYCMTDVHQFTRNFLGAVPWDDEEIYRKTSPLTYIKRACTPTLIQHGDNDNRVPVSNAYELYRGLKDMNVPVEMVIFKGMKHNTDKPGIARAIMKQNLTWFCHHILGEPMNDSDLRL